MPQGDAQPGPDRQLLVPQLIVGSMTAGLVVFALVVAVFIERPKVEGGVLLPIAALFFIGCAIVVWILPQAYAARLRGGPAAIEKRAAGDLLPAFTTLTILRSALMEGAGLLFLVTYLAEGNRVALWVTALAVFHLATLLPTRAAYERFVAVVEGGGSHPR